MARGETKTRSRKEKDSPPENPRLCLVCPLSDCFYKRKGCLQIPENRSRGHELLKTGANPGREDR